jgi:hypothetical protein
VRLELLRQVVVRGVVARDHQEARGAPVEPVDDAGALHPADARQLVEVVQQGVDQGAIVVACAGVDDHAGVFVDNDGQTYLFYQGNADKGKSWYLSKLKIGWKKDRPVIDDPIASR